MDMESGARKPASIDTGPATYIKHPRWRRGQKAIQQLPGPDQLQAVQPILQTVALLGQVIVGSNVGV
jgi:hypothetical protein